MARPASCDGFAAGVALLVLRSRGVPWKVAARRLGLSLERTQLWRMARDAKIELCNTLGVDGGDHPACSLDPMSIESLIPLLSTSGGAPALLAQLGGQVNATRAGLAGAAVAPPAPAAVPGLEDGAVAEARRRLLTQPPQGRAATLLAGARRMPPVTATTPRLMAGAA